MIPKFLLCILLSLYGSNLPPTSTILSFTLVTVHVWKYTIPGFELFSWLQKDVHRRHFLTTRSFFFTKIGLFNSRAAHVNTYLDVVSLFLSPLKSFIRNGLAAVQRPHQLSVSYSVIASICNTPLPLMCAFVSLSPNLFAHWAMWVWPWCHPKLLLYL